MLYGMATSWRNCSDVLSVAIEIPSYSCLYIVCTKIHPKLALEQALAAADRDVFCRILNSASSGVPTTSSGPLISIICPEEHLNWMAFLLVEGLGEFPSKADGKIVAACCNLLLRELCWLEQLEKWSLKWKAGSKQLASCWVRLGGSSSYCLEQQEVGKVMLCCQNC